MTGNGSAVDWALGRAWWVVCWAAPQEQCWVAPCGSCRISTNRCAQNYLARTKFSQPPFPGHQKAGAGAAPTGSPHSAGALSEARPANAHKRQWWLQTDALREYALTRMQSDSRIKSRLGGSIAPGTGGCASQSTLLSCISALIPFEDVTMPSQACC